ncbi:MAG: Psudogene of putative outer membrane protein pmp20 precursor [Methanobrevibacter sp. CfCl-M3]
MVKKNSNHADNPKYIILNSSQSIKEAIDNANDGDIIILDGGTYNGTGNYNIDVNKSVTIKAKEDMEVIIDAEGKGRVFSNVVADAILDGLVITGGKTKNDGGGVVNNGSLINCTIKNNAATNAGGVVNNGSLINCTISNNIANNAAGVDNRDKGNVKDCIVTGNTASNFGGVFNSGSVTVCTISNNTANNNFGGVGNNGIVTACTILNNTANNDIGGIYNIDNGKVKDSTIIGNKSNNNFGGVFNNGAIITNCTIKDNIATNAAGVFNNSGSVIDCTISDNREPPIDVEYKIGNIPELKENEDEASISISANNFKDSSSKNDEKVKIQSLKNYEEQIQDLKEKYQDKEAIARKKIKECFPPPQMTYDRFIDEIDMWNEVFINQVESALSMIDMDLIGMASEHVEKVEDELKKRLDTMKSFVEKIEELIVEVLFNSANSNEKSVAGEVEELLDDMQKVINSVKEYR